LAKQEILSYVTINIVVVNPKKPNNPAIKALVNALKSGKVKTFILEKYKVQLFLQSKYLTF
jgi:ABC-type metal ion transport system substrate-binding protein